MLLIYKDDIPILKESTSIIPGIFDGIHRGHQRLIKEAVTSSNKKGIAPCLLTFNPHPRSAPYILQDKERDKILEELGIKHFVIADFNKIKALSPHQYIELLLINLKMKEIWTGCDYGFGKNRKGDIKMLKTKGKELGFSLFILPDISYEFKRISTSYIKNLLLEGKIKEANALFGRPYSFSGVVVSSTGRGKKLDFPTANILWDEGLFLPRKGVYFVKIKIGKKTFDGMANLGTRSTFDEKSCILETHIFDFKRDIYGKEITVFFYSWIRDEMKFRNCEELSIQIKKDEKICRGLRVL